MNGRINLEEAVRAWIVSRVAIDCDVVASFFFFSCFFGKPRVSAWQRRGLPRVGTSYQLPVASRKSRRAAGGIISRVME
jgi:hypothetical protein